MNAQRSRWEPWDDFWQVPQWFEDTVGGTAFGTDLGGPVEPTEIEDLAPKHFIAFLVLDGAGDPYPGLGYALSGPDGQREAGRLGSDAQVRRDNVPNDDYHLELESVLDVTWTLDAADCGEAIGITGTVSGYEDGTTAEIRIFRQHRETDDDVVATLDATVEGGCVQAEWSYDPDGPNAVPTPPSELAFVAQLRIPDKPGWAKTLQPVRVTMPRVEVARWSRRATAPGKTVMMLVDLVGVPDDSPVTLQVFRQLRSGAQELLTTLEGIAVDDNGVAVPWIYECDPEDLAATEAECLFVVTSEVYLDVTKTSGPLWVSSAVGRKVRRRQRRAR